MDSDNKRQQIRMNFFEAWRKYKSQIVLEPLEQQLIYIILNHPEYQFILDEPEKYLERDFFPEIGEINPFLHMGLHLSILEQVTTNRPSGIRDIYYSLINKKGNALNAEHTMMECLIKNLQHAQETGTMVSDEIYLQELKKLLQP